MAVKPKNPTSPPPPPPVDHGPVPPRRTCGTMQVHHRLLRTDPAYVRARAASENYAQDFRMRGRAQARVGVTSIPVVVHVVHNTAAQDLSDAQIQSQIDVLNRDFRMKNADISSVPTPFKPLAADARIEFKLATTDPAGNPTTGITRTQTAQASFTDDDGIKSSAAGGADAWPADRYLNVWTAPRLTSPQGDLLGYAQFPGGPAATDGVVILHSAFGTSGTAAAPFDLGRTATHEVGHWLNLRHIWGDDGNGCNGSDFVNDTPNQAGPNFGAPGFPHTTCNNGPDGDMFMDYMDYVDDVAMFMFTTGQVERMQACLDGDRSSIGTMVPTLPAVDQPTLKFADDPTIPTLKFRDDPPPTLKFQDDPPPTLKFRDDPPPTLKFQDDPIPTLKFRDDPQPTLKFRDDPIPTLKFRDDGPTLKFSDDGGTTPALDQPQTLKFRDDVKLPQLDPQKLPGSDQPGFPQPGGPLAGGRGAPFVLSTPHHSMAWTQTFPQAAEAAVAGYEQQIAQYEQLLEQYAQADAAGQLGPQDVSDANALHEEYQALLQEYRQLTGR